VNASVVAPEMMRLRMNDRENKAIWTSNSIRHCLRIAPLAASHVSQFFSLEDWAGNSVGRPRRHGSATVDIFSMARERPALNSNTGKVGHDACELRPQINSSAAWFINA
jgi:hypothetical protein